MLTPLLVSFVVAALAVGLGWRPFLSEGTPSSKLPPERSGPLANALGAGLIGLVAYVAIQGGELPPLESWRALPWVGLAMLVPALVSLLGPWLGLDAFATVTAAGLWFVLGPYRENQWAESGEFWRWWLWLILGFTAVLAPLQLRAARRPEGGEAPLLLLLVLCASAKLVFDGGSSAAALQLGGLATLVGGLAVAGFWRGDLPVLRGLPAPLGWLLLGFLLQGYLYASLEPWPALLAAGALAAVGLPGSGREALVLRWLVVLGLLGTAIYLGWPEPDPYGDYY